MSSFYSKLWDAIVITCSDHKTALEFEKGMWKIMLKYSSLLIVIKVIKLLPVMLFP